MTDPDPATQPRAQALVTQRYTSGGRGWVRRGRRYPDRMHPGLDIPGPHRTFVCAALGGRVIFSGRKRGYGNVVLLLHESPPPTEVAGAGRLTTAYCHLDERLVSWGEAVTADQVIARMGNTTTNEENDSGRVRVGMGTHLHFSVQLLDGDEARDRFSDEQGVFEGSRPRPDPTDQQLAGRGQGWFGSPYEEDWTRQVKPDDWLSELGIAQARASLPRSRRRYRPRRRASQLASLALLVQDRQGAPISNEPFEVHFADGTHLRGRTNEDGTASLQELPEGEARLHLTRRTGEQVTVSTQGGAEGEDAEEPAPQEREPEPHPSEGHPITTSGEVIVTCTRQARIRRVWVWLQGSPTRPQLANGGTRDADQDGIPDATEYVRDRIGALNVTDAVVSINDHGWAGRQAAYRTAARAGTFPEPTFGVKGQYRPIENLITLIERLRSEGNVDVHLMAFVGPWSTFLRDCAQVMAEVAGRTTLRSIQLDCEWWWTLHPSRQRAVGGEAVKRFFFDEWTGARPELGVGVTGVASAGGALRSVLRWCDFGVPQVYASARNYGQDLTSARTLQLARRHHQSYLDSLISEASLTGIPKRVFVGQTAFQRYVGTDGQRMRDICDVLLQIGDPSATDGSAPTVEEIAYWSDKWLQPRYNRAGRLFVQGIAAQARGDGLTRSDLTDILP